MRVQSLSRKDPLRRKWQPTPILLPGKFHGQRSLAGYSPWGHKELDTAERLSTAQHTLMYACMCIYTHIWYEFYLRKTYLKIHPLCNYLVLMYFLHKFMLFYGVVLA